MEVEIIEIGIGYEIKITISNIKLVTHKGFDTIIDARAFLHVMFIFAYFLPCCECYRTLPNRRMHMQTRDL